MSHQFMYPKVVSISVGSGFGNRQQNVAFPAAQVATSPSAVVVPTPPAR